MTQDNLDGLAIVTGAGQGIGRAIALSLLNAGCPVLAVGRSAAKLDTLAAQAGVPETQVITAALDIRDRDGFCDAMARAEAACGPTRYLVNNAGVLMPARLLDMPEDALRETIEINLTGTVLLTQIVARAMAERGQGAIVTIGSNSSNAARTGLGIYPASKAGLAHAMTCLGLELAEHGVRCNVVAPGSTDTPMQAGFQSDASSLDRVIHGDCDLWRLGIPLGRMAAPQDVADLTLFLLSERARHITMETIVIDGGATLGAR